MQTISDEQLEASHLNAPAAEEPKPANRLNAGRNGFTGQVVIMADEDRKAYNDHIRTVVDGLQPRGAIEKQLAFSIAEDYWRLNRMRAMETNILSAGPVSDLLHLNADNPQTHDAARQILAFVRDPQQFGVISLYVQRTERSLARNLAHLEKLQERRQAELDLELEIAANSQTTSALPQGADGTPATDSETTETNASRELSQVEDGMERTYPGKTAAVTNASGHADGAARTYPAGSRTLTNANGRGFVFSSDQIARHRLRLQAKRTLKNSRPTPTTLRKLAA